MTAFIPSTTPFSKPPPSITLPRFSCTSSPEPRLPDGNNLSNTDRQYIAKVRAKLLNARRAAKIAKDSPPDDPDADSDAQLTANLPDNLDEIDDILFDRGPKNTDHVRLFGGWLDDSVAGRKARDPKVTPSLKHGDQVDPNSAYRTSLSKEEAVRQATDIFAAAMEAFNKGRYRVAAGLYDEAVQLVGVESRLGGQYRLWHAQALDALGEKQQAAKFLETLRTHSDLDVRKVSAELLFIITAPKLELEPGTFLDIPMLDDETRSGRLSPVLNTNFGELRTALIEKEPEPYSLEWYMKKERPPKTEDNSAMEVLFVFAAVAFTLGYMLSTSPR